MPTYNLHVSTFFVLTLNPKQNNHSFPRNVITDPIRADYVREIQIRMVGRCGNFGLRFVWLAAAAVCSFAWSTSEFLSPASALYTPPSHWPGRACLDKRQAHSLLHSLTPPRLHHSLVQSGDQSIAKLTRAAFLCRDRKRAPIFFTLHHYHHHLRTRHCRRRFLHSTTTTPHT
jgi:hypothetical protein